MTAEPLTVVSWKWHTPGYRSRFSAQHVNVLRSMVARHYPAPHRFVCVTDDRVGLDPGIEVLPLWTEFAHLKSPHGGHNPSCYRRLRLFHPDAGAVFGPRFVSLDLDTVITGDLRPLWDRAEDFVMWGETDPRSYYNGSMMLLTAGARPTVWTQFDPARSPVKAKAAGKFGSDQGWISYCLGPGEATWTTRDGVYSWRVHLARTNQLPPNARIVMFHGGRNPWDRPLCYTPWIRQSWR